jgi:phytoene synthase
MLLAEWRSEIARLYTGRPQRIVTRALCVPVRRYELRCDDFLAIIDGAEMDVRKDIRAPSLVEFDLYCSRVAVSAAMLAVRIFGDATPAGGRVAEELGRALQLTSILGGLRQDAARHRLYLPRPTLQAHGILATIPSVVIAHPGFSPVCRDVAALAEERYAAAGEAIARCTRHPMRPVAAMLALNRAILRALIARGWERLHEPVHIPALRKAALLVWRGLAGRT